MRNDSQDDGYRLQGEAGSGRDHFLPDAGGDALVMGAAAAVRPLPISLDAFESGMLRRFFRQQSARWFAMLAIGEFGLLVLSMVLAVGLRFWGSPEALMHERDHLLGQSLLFAAMITLALGALGLYQRYLREGLFGTVTRLVLGFGAGTVGLIVVYYAFPDMYAGRGVLGIAVGIGLVLVASFRAAFFRLISEETFRRRVLVLGTGERANLICRRMRRRADQRAVNILGFVRMPNDTSAVDASRMVRLEDGALVKYAREQRLDEIVVAPDDRRGGLPMADLLACRLAGIEVIELTRFFERETGKIKLTLVDPSWLVFSGGFKSTVLRLISKRCFDVVMASLMIAALWPFMALVALAIRLESRRGDPILYRQERVGEGGRVFELIKFRSMRTDAEKDGVARWASKGDSRVTRVGAFIRRTRLDELPQLWNVLRGDMSVVGPRPERPQFVAELAEQIPYYNLRHCVKPGLAGWAQLRYPYGATVEDAVEKLKYDLFYVKNHNLLFELLILIQTVEVVLFGRGVR